MARTAKAKADPVKKTSSAAASKEEAVANMAVVEPVAEKKEETEGPAEAPKKRKTTRKGTAKKTAEAKPEEKAAEEVKAEEKPEEVKAEAPAEKAEEKPEEVKAEAPAPKAEEKPKKAPAKKSDAAKKSTRSTANKKADAKTEKVEEIYIQFLGQEISTNDILERVKQAYKEEGHRVALIKSMKLYIKPEDGMAYYVINDKHEGKIAL